MNEEGIRTSRRHAAMLVLCAAGLCVSGRGLAAEQAGDTSNRPMRTRQTLVLTVGQTEGDLQGTDDKVIQAGHRLPASAGRRNAPHSAGRVRTAKRHLPAAPHHAARLGRDDHPEKEPQRRDDACQGFRLVRVRRRGERPHGVRARRRHHAPLEERAGRLAIRRPAGDDHRRSRGISSSWTG